MLQAALMAGALWLGQSTSPPVAQEPTEPATVIEDVEVSGRPLDRQVASFLDEISLPEASLKVARWQDKVCVGVVNLRSPSGQFVADRVSQIALDLGLDAGEPGCRPNIMILATNDGSGLAAGMVERRRGIFDPGGQGMVRTKRALNTFMTTDAPIRWWHVAIPVDSRTGLRANRLPGEEAPQVSGRASRLRTEIRNDLGYVVIIMDIAKLEGLDMLQIADYAAMVAFSQVDIDADFSGYDTVLSLMTDRSVRGLTDWDKAYLQALYSAELSQVYKGQQTGEIGRLMAQRHRARTQAPVPVEQD
jgi:hypothetical protein